MTGSSSSSTTTNTSGAYSFSVVAGGSYTITPALLGYTFSPISANVNGISSNQTFGFVGTSAPSTYTISGAITSGGVALSGVTMTLSGSSSSTTSTTGGAYSFTVASGGSYTVTPSLGGYTFSPISANVNGIGSNQTFGFVGTSAMTA